MGAVCLLGRTDEIKAMGNLSLKNFRDEANRTKVLDIQWFELPPKFRQAWRKATDYGQHPPSPEFAAQMPELLAEAQAKLEAERREQTAAIAAARALFRQAEARRPCEQCSHACKRACLRVLLAAGDEP